MTERRTGPSDPLAPLQPDLDANGDPLPAVGTRVACRRRSDGARLEGVVEYNRMGLFLSDTGGPPAVLTASLWDVTAMPEEGTGE